ncbi:polysaccharide deacetylase family protein [Brevibacillus ruminantium]|uniref:Polysaccharide deacetylase family protein n=1 Tax=Brevibacillus ruminantium TaxID=2950604 RepID=A0ABY4WDR4_9BACL|nr:polysaccharide deacetylase family protein [Brevibacillus ruminantium]USG65316.1 polysaccharide deacetylase family protein [Brevibacillus ruminantium]
MKDISIMYHYVQIPGLKGIFPFDPKEFELQIEWATKHYDIVAPDDLNKPRGKKPYCVLTFDDATKDQYEIAFPILQKKGIPAYFTVMSGPLLERRVPVFHLIHTVLSFFTDEEIWRELTARFDVKAVPERSHYYSYESSPFRRYNKYALNFHLTEQQSRSFLEEKALSVFHSFENFINSYYINEREFIKMCQAGMTLGVHAAHHRPFTGDAKAFYDSEIEPCRKFMADRLGVDAKWYTPAFGGGTQAERMMKELGEVLRDHGFKGAFTTKSGFNNGLDSFWLHRYDCISLPPRSEVPWK